MALPQTGIFALGNPAHSYLEFDLIPSADPLETVRTVADVAEPRTTMGGVNLVCGFGPTLWGPVGAGRRPAELPAFTEAVRGQDGFEMPATQHDLALWIAGGSYDVVFDASITLIAALAPYATVADETAGWTYHRDLDLTGFIDGTENPKLPFAPQLVLVPDGQPGAGGSVLLLQKWIHDSAAWTALTDAEQERVIGRTKADSVELDPRPETSHVARTDQADFGDIFRRNTPFGSAREHGTMFVGFSSSATPLATMLASMAGVEGPRDALTHYSRPVSGSYYYVPSLEDLTSFATPEEEDD